MMTLIVILYIDIQQLKYKKQLKFLLNIIESLFFLTQVITRKAGSLSHVPYRNSSLTKMLKSSLGGNAKTCIILCLSPSRSQFDHSLQTLKFGMSARRIENKATKNIGKTNSEDTLKLLIEEYQSRLEALNLQETKIPSEKANELASENNMLLQQLVDKPTDSACLIKFSLDSETDSIECSIEPNTKIEQELTQKSIEALKIQCKLANIYEQKALFYQKQNEILKEKLSSLRSQYEQLKANFSARNLMYYNLCEVTEDYIKLLKSQTAKLEVYEKPEKWALQLSSKELLALQTHFRQQVEKIGLLQTNLKNTNAPPKEIKLTISSKFEEAFVATLLKNGKQSEALEMSTEDEYEEAIFETDTHLQNTEVIQICQEMLNVIRQQPKSTKKTLSPIKELSSPPKPTLNRSISPNKSIVQQSCKTPIAKKSNGLFQLDNVVSPIRKQNHQIQQINQESKVVSRSTSSSSRKPPVRTEIRLPTSRNTPRDRSSSKKAICRTPRLKFGEKKAKHFEENRNTPIRSREIEANTIFKQGLFSQIQSVRHLAQKKEEEMAQKPSLIIGEVTNLSKKKEGETMKTWQKLLSSITFD